MIKRISYRITAIEHGLLTSGRSFASTCRHAGGYSASYNTKHRHRSNQWIAV